LYIKFKFSLEIGLLSHIFEKKKLIDKKMLISIICLSIPDEKKLNSSSSLKSIKLGSFDMFLHETKESSKKKPSASRTEIFIVKVHYLG